MSRKNLRCSTVGFCAFIGVKIGFRGYFSSIKQTLNKMQKHFMLLFLKKKLPRKFKNQS